MRRLLTALMILLVVLLAGLTALVLLINPNDFRQYMVQTVEQRSGYKLTLDGALRWHVWPQLSILSGRMSLTAPGGSEPLVSADNMRLDVALLPLLSHRLQVEQVMLKKAVIQLTPQSEERRPENAPVAPGETRARVSEHRGWSFDIGRLQVVDSVLVFQHADDEQFTVRNIQLELEKTQHRQARIALSGRVNRDQRDLNLSLDAVLDACSGDSDFNATITRLDYQLQGADLPAQGIRGQGTLQARWEEEPRRLSISSLKLAANDSSLRGGMSVVLGEKTRWRLDLASDNLNLDSLIARIPRVEGEGEGDDSRQASPAVLPRPVIAGGEDVPAYSLLHRSLGEAALNVASLRWRGLTFSNVSAHFINRDGLLSIEQLDGHYGKGMISLPGEIDARGARSRVVFQPQVKEIDIAPILRAFDYPLALSGNLSMRGRFSGSRIDAEAFRHSWQGSASVEMTNSKLEGMNFQQLVQRAVTRNSGNAQAVSNDDNATVMQRFSASAILNNGQLQLQQMAGQSSVLALTGEGALDLVKEQCDARFAVQVTGGWEEKGELVEKLKQTPIPLRIYGSWNQLNYHLDVDRVLRDRLEDEGKRRLKAWAERNKDSSKARDVQQLLEERDRR
ncbi:outer membrane assembly protein AsmA [Enterobacteriaceae bacterium YMB-R22]|jgi:AsmA protein|uniref:outer membrane assembly protein AsmA n=1 Tax=Tenebrionicola larvae TaxID=2815733 RepID=UPI00201390F0|nr:outer membrane assembly protein AsmA [Tenebrionicola larvae]MBV4412026.1 outer membrane assembly protein AsmA [Tenebrionicola larvae]